MANIIILGGGFSGVAAAESLAKHLTSEHQITLVSRSSRFVSHPSLVGLAFGKHGIDDISHDLREALHDRRIRFVQGEVARVDPYQRLVTFAHGEVRGHMPYDYLIFALGGRLATERITGFFEHAHHTLTVEAALKFGEAIRGFKEGRALIGYSPEARLAVPAYETAFALSRFLEDRGQRRRAQITIVSPKPTGAEPAASERALRNALNEQNIEFLPDISINRITAKSVVTSLGAHVDYDLLMLLPPLRGASAVRGMGITDHDGFIRVDSTMRVEGVEGMYAVGDCASFSGPKMGHMAVSQAEVARQSRRRSKGA
jgi:sulfide:quinone oxidoreductase